MELAIELSDIHRYIRNNCDKRFRRRPTFALPTRHLIPNIAMQMLIIKLSRDSGGRPLADNRTKTGNDNLQGAYERLERVLYPPEQDEPDKKKEAPVSEETAWFGTCGLHKVAAYQSDIGRGLRAVATHG